MQAPDVVVVGAATRDLNDDDPRGWLLGGGVTFGALALARLGLRTGVVLGLDAKPPRARELELIRERRRRDRRGAAGAGPRLHQRRDAGRSHPDLRLAQRPGTGRGPAGRAWRDAPAWVFAPIASELPADWVDVPSAAVLRGLRLAGHPARTRCRRARPCPGSRAHRPSWRAPTSSPPAVTMSPATSRCETSAAWLGAACDVLLTAGLAGRHAHPLRARPHHAGACLPQRALTRWRSTRPVPATRCWPASSRRASVAGDAARCWPRPPPGRCGIQPAGRGTGHGLGAHLRPAAGGAVTDVLDSAPSVPDRSSHARSISTLMRRVGMSHGRAHQRRRLAALRDQPQQGADRPFGHRHRCPAGRS